MIRRWVIRGLALTLLTLCVGAWVGSYFAMVWAGYDAATWNGRLVIERGTFETSDARAFGRRKFVNLGGDGWHAGWQRAKGAAQPAFQFGGFGYWSRSLTAVGQQSVYIPLWFPILLSALLLWLVWRKTRPKYNGRGFPVEAAGKGATKP